VNAVDRLLRPRSVALIGGHWTDAVAAASRAIGYTGQLWRVHPTRPSTTECRYFRSVDELPAPPDQAFLAVAAPEAVKVAAALQRRGAGGFVCFASGFSELGTEQGRALTADLLAGAPTVPFFGPNCYGIVNFFDRCALWPDQLVGVTPERGVALICQSGTIALTLMFNDRSVPIGYIFTVGNQTRLAIEDLIEMLCEDGRVSAFGLYVEGIKDPERFARAAARARAAGKPIALVKTGRTATAARTAHSHTGALAGSDNVFDAFCRQAAIARCETLSTLCETLKILHVGGPLAGRRVLVMGASGGDMAMTADVSRDLGLHFPAFTAATSSRLGEILGERVTIANPFDFHTYTWFDPPRQRALFDTALACELDAVAFMLDCPPAQAADLSSFTAVIDEFVAAAAASAASGRAPRPRAALLASLPETMPPAVRAQCLKAGVVPLQGQRESLEALSLCGAMGESWSAGGSVDLARPRGPIAATALITLLERDAKAALASYGVPVPPFRQVPASAAVDAALELGFPVVMKVAAAEVAHKSEIGGVILNLRSEQEARAAAARLAKLSDQVLVESMISDGVAEVLVGLLVDAQFGLTLVLASGGVLTELVRDSVTLLPPYTRSALAAALRQLAVFRLLSGYRGRPAGDVPALIEAILGITNYATAKLDVLSELDVNPIIVRAAGAGVVAVDALISLSKEQ
jgi:acetate---CoA ligase (ADP-forming)